MAMRKDTPAARIALAKRRQRLKANLNEGTTTTTSNANAPDVSNPPSVIRSSRPPMSGSLTKQRAKPNLQVMTTDSSDYDSHQPPVKEVIHSPNSRLSPLAKRAMNKHKNTSPTDGTMTTAALTSAASATHYTSSSDREIAAKVLEHSRQVAKSAHSVLDQAPPSSSIRTGTSRGDTTASRIPTAKASTTTASSSSFRKLYSSSHRLGARVEPISEEGPLDARRQKLESPSNKATRSSSPNKPARASKAPSPQHKTTTIPNKPTKGTGADEDRLTASRQKRNTLENKYRFNVAKRSPQANSNDNNKGNSSNTNAFNAQTRRKNRIQVAARQRSPSPSPSRQRANLQLPPLANQPTHTSSNTHQRDDPMSATRRKMEESETQEDHPILANRRKPLQLSNHSQPPKKGNLKEQPPPPLEQDASANADHPSPNRVIPRRNASPRRQSPLKSISPRRFQAQPSQDHEEDQYQSQNSMHQKPYRLPPRNPSPRHSNTQQQRFPSPREAVPTSSPNKRQVKNTIEHSPPRRQHQQQHAEEPSYRASSSPRRRISSSLYVEHDAPRSSSRPRPTPVETTLSEEEGMDGAGAAEHDNYFHRQEHGLPNTVQVGTPPRNAESRNQMFNNNNSNSGRHSPGVERLSGFLMDSSSVNDISTIADMTLHQMESSPSFERRYVSSPIREKNRHDENNYSSPSAFQRGISSRQQQHQQQSPSYHHHENYNDNTHDQAEKYDDIDEQGTVDDGKLLTMDSACLKTGLTIMLRAYCNNSTIVGVNSDEKQDFVNGYLAEALGLCLGRDEELLQVRKVLANANDSEDLRHGDTVVFFSTATEGHSLGVQIDSNLGHHHNRTGSSRMRLGFFPSESTVSDTWMVLSARPDREVLVGRAAVASKAPQANKATPAPVRSGDHVLIRSCYNGGILSIDGRGHLTLLTDSYGSRGYLDSEDPTPMGRLQNHDRLYPSPRETFQLLISSTPPCPQWITGRSMDERVFLTGSYILQPRRNQRNAEFETNLFSGSQSQASSALSYMERHTPSDANLSAEVKEKILIDEVIGSFLGLEGRHIRLKGTKGHTSSLENYEFQLFGADGVGFDVSLTHLVEQILPLSTSYVRVRNFISSRHPGYEYGRVMHALCEGLDFLLQDYVNFVNQMERQHRKYSRSDPLTMKNIYYQITPSLHSMSILEHATKHACEKKGGDLINALWALDKRSYMGDAVAKKVLGILLDRASVPYMEMMSSWLQTGVLKDPYEEFMIRRPSQHEKTKAIELDGDAWMALFEIDEMHVLRDVITNDWTKKKILTTGRYWNAVNACSIDQKSYGEISQAAYKIPKLEFNSDSSAIAAYIDNMYQHASRVLLRLMMQDFRLMDSLGIVRRYFLLDQGDFLMNFLDASEQELVKQAENVSVGRVQHCLSMAIQQTEGYREDWDSVAGAADEQSQCPIDPKRLRCRLSAQSLVAQLDLLHGSMTDLEPPTPGRHAYGMSSKGNTGIEVFQIEFPRIPFPISLALSRHAMDSYKLLFRHLFFTKHVERRLIGVWRDHQVLKKLDSVRALLGPTFLLRQRMLHLVQNLIYYMTFEVIESNWVEMVSSIDVSADPMAPQSQRNHTVDDILNVHDEFLNKTLGACLLSNKGLFRSLTRVLNTCLLFTDQMRRFMDTTRIHDDSKNLAAEKRGAIQRSLNERGYSQSAVDRRVLHRNLKSLREERMNLLYRQTRKVGREVASDSYKKMVARFDEVFNADLTDFMMQLNTHTETGLVANLGIRLDYNGYVTAAIASANNR